MRAGGVVIVALVLGACTAVQSEEAVPIEPEPPPVAATPVTGAPREMIDAALDDAAQRTSLARADIAVVAAEAVTWADGSLGCPKPGMLYTMALVSGYRIVVRAGTETLEYHAASRGKPVFCPAERLASPSPVVSPL